MIYFSKDHAIGGKDCSATGEIRKPGVVRAGRQAVRLGLNEAEDAADRIASGKAAGPLGFQPQFGFGGVDQFGEAVDRQRHKAIIIAEDQIAGLYGATTEADGHIDRAVFGSGWAAWGDGAAVDGEICKAREGGGVADRTVADNASRALGMQLAAQNISDHRMGSMARSGDHQDLPRAGLADGVQHGTEIGGGAVDGDGAGAQTGLLACGAQRADGRADLLAGGEINRDGDGDVLPTCQQVGGDWGKGRMGLGDGHGLSFVEAGQPLMRGWP